jgi:phospholipid transport system transporter-binding protein
MIRPEGDVYRVEGPVTIENVRGVIEEGRRVFSGGDLRVDLGGLENVDSSALSMLLEWMRDAAASGRRVRYLNVPENLASLARVYGVLDHLPVAA